MDVTNESGLQTKAEDDVETIVDETDLVEESNTDNNDHVDQCREETSHHRSVPANTGTSPQIPSQGKGRLKLGSSISTDNSSSINSKTTFATRVDIGTDAPPTVTYLTQYSIDHNQQSDGLCREVLLAECVQCFNCKRGRTRCNGWKIVLWFLWAFISSELFLYALHVTSIVIGALDAVLGLRQEDPKLALFNSSVETTATLLLILIRMANAYTGYLEVKKTVRHEENFDPKKDIHVRLLKRWMTVFELIGLTIFGFSLACFLVFYYNDHLDWTILSNNLCLITILVLATLYRARVVLAITRIREDQHKIVIYEAILVIQEAMQPTAEADNSITKIFVRAVEETKLFFKPSYIKYMPIEQDSSGSSSQEVHMAMDEKRI